MQASDLLEAEKPSLRIDVPPEISRVMEHSMPYTQSPGSTSVVDFYSQMLYIVIVCRATSSSCIEEQAQVLHNYITCLMIQQSFCQSTCTILSGAQGKLMNKSVRVAKLQNKLPLRIERRRYEVVMLFFAG